MAPLYEIHLIVFGPLYRLFEAVSSTEVRVLSVLNPRATVAVTAYGNHPEQPMLTFWYRGDEVFETCAKVEGILKAKGLTTLRRKIEGVGSDATPDVAEGDHYFEYHFKVPVEGEAEWERLAGVCAPHGAHLFFNAFSRSGVKVPVITLRHYDCTRVDSLAKLDLLVAAISEAGFAPAKEVEREYSVVDTNVELDSGWLFDRWPKNILRAVPVV